MGPGALTGGAGVLQGARHRDGRRGHVATRVGDGGSEPPHLDLGRVVDGCRRDPGADEGVEPLAVDGSLDPELGIQQDRGQSPDGHGVPPVAGPFHGGLEHPDRRLGRGRILVGPSERELDVGPVGSEGQRALEQVEGAGHVALLVGPDAFRPEPVRGPQREPIDGFAPVAQLDPQPMGGLEVIPDEHLHLGDPIARVGLHPVGEALVETRALALRDRLVGGVADEHVPEPERPAGDLVAVRPDQVLAREPLERVRNRRSRVVRA